MLADAPSFARFAWGLGAFLRRSHSPDEFRQRVEEQLRNRSESFLRLLERGVFARPNSPYLRLFVHAGIGFEDVAESVRRDGIEPTLGVQFDQVDVRRGASKVVEPRRDVAAVYRLLD